MVIDLLDGPTSNFGPFILPARLFDPSAIDAVIRVAGPATIRRQPTQQSLAFVGGTSAFDFVIDPLASEPIDGEVAWFALVFGPGGLSIEGIELQVDPTDSTRATVRVVDWMLGDVVLYASYNSTNGAIVFADPVVVVSHPPGGRLVGIELVPSSLSLHVGEELGLDLWGRYDNGARSLLFIPPDASLALSSSDPLVVEVDTNRVITALSSGVATITATWQGLSAQADICVGEALLAPATFASIRKLPSGEFQLDLMTEPGQCYTLEASTNLLDWVALTTLNSTGSLTTFVDALAPNFPQRFYRVVSP